MYGLMLLLGIAVCIVVTGIRWQRRGGDWDTIFRVAVWGVAAGVVGARAYHVLTDWDTATEEWWTPFAVWEGGLGIWGGIALGALVGGFIAHRSGVSALALLDAAAPGLLIAQAIGRWGNWWNQELFGKETDVAWALEVKGTVDNGVVVAEDSGETGTYHPTFLYEFVWNLLAAGVLLAVDRFWRMRPPALFALYIALYTLGRFFIERLRIDPSPELAGMRVNAWVALAVFVLAALFFVWWQLVRPWLRRRRGGRRGGGGVRRPPSPRSSSRSSSGSHGATSSTSRPAASSSCSSRRCWS
jgi:prolipoprotein diacylglyceryl transferase